MTNDLDAMTRAQLVKLRGDVDKAISTLADRERRAALDAAEKAVAAHGFTLSELTGAAPEKGRSRKSSAAPKYRNPADSSQTWSGRGRRPDWVNAALAQGKGLSDLAI